MPNAIKKLKQEEKVVLAYAQLKLRANRLSKELDTMKQNIVDCFDRTNQNLIIVQDDMVILLFAKINVKEKSLKQQTLKSHITIIINSLLILNIVNTKQ